MVAKHRAKRLRGMASRFASGTPRSRGRIAAAIAAVFALAAAPLIVSTVAQAVNYTFTIDSLDASTNANNTRDANPGDGVCRTAAGTCTMRAALEESNALKAPKGAVLITVADGFTGNISATDGAGRMNTARVSNQDAGAHFEITAPVTIDLKNQVTMQTATDTGSTAFHINGPDVEFRNMSYVLSGESSFVVGPQANGFVIDGGETSTDRDYYPERFMVIREGAKNITVQNYRIQGFYHAANATGIFYFNAQNNTPIENFTVDNVQLTYPTATTCNSSNGSGCQTDVTQFNPRTQNVVIDGFAFKNSSVSNLTSRAGFPFSNGTAATSVRASNIDISSNSFINMAGAGTGVNNAFISLPFGPMAGTNRVEDNTITRASSGQTFGLSWNGNTTSGSAGDLSIAGNYFDGYSGTSVYLSNTGDVNVERNTFGSRSASQARPGTAEETRDGTTSLLDNANNANGRVNTWFPSANAQVLTTDAPQGTVEAVSPLADDVPVCIATVDVQAPTATPLPASVVDLDVYWTGDRTAEVHLGRVEKLSGSTATVQLALPVGPQKFPTTVVGGTQDVTIVNEDTGVAGGYIRLQTIGADSGQSSQYSRIVGFSGNCRPELTINQADTQNDPTLARDLHYTVKSSLPLDPETVTTETIGATAAATAQTIDAARINPRAVSVEAVAGTSNREFDVVVRADDSAVVTAAIAAGKVTSVGGLTNRGPATNTDAKITFTNPISLRPESFTLVTGEPDGKEYGFQLAAGAPTPTADLAFTSSLDAAGSEHGVKLSTSSPTIPAGKTASQDIRVTASEGNVAANTAVLVNHSVRSDDPNYDRLVVRSLDVKLFSTDPSIQITKRAFVDVADTSSPERIMATGTEALSGTRLTDGQSVCFVYTVTNISADDWATVLTDVTVTDSDTRLGTDGVIGRVPELKIGASTQLSSCGALIPVDTTVGGAA